ncbi:hypothetical protein OSB04_004852 [Centaurea solstitialis]|uniref:Uncharacterized protein n=1 Tax=Centaurea solstitialis TaxID=347529 RepID=A0AA38TXW7_9ASTR|nr:hypothetical protein OSB04_004852 [Centaurea solstitialis]
MDDNYPNGGSKVFSSDRFNLWRVLFASNRQVLPGRERRKLPYEALGWRFSRLGSKKGSGNEVGHQFEGGKSVCQCEPLPSTWKGKFFVSAAKFIPNF